MTAAIVAFDGPARADCMVQPNQQAPDGTHWSLHFDQATNRRCWILVDGAGREVSAQPGTTVFQSFISSITGQQQQQPQEAPPASPAASPPRPQTLHRTPRPPAVRPESEATATKHGMSQPERDALFEEFLRWHESRKITGADKK
jgi:hypothetical protein